MKSFKLSKITFCLFFAVPAFAQSDEIPAGRGPSSVRGFTSENIPRAEPVYDNDTLSRMEAHTGVGMTNDFFHIVENGPHSWRYPRTPWMDRRWRLDKGMIGDRYRSEGFRSQSDFYRRYNFVKRYDFMSIAEEALRTSGVVDAELSPAEKYDLLVGDTNGTLTRKIWDFSKGFADSNSIASWMALCDGSAAAGIVFAEPRRSFELPSAANNVRVRFQPFDVKALASLFYSEISLPHIPIVGGRCNGNMESKECREPSPEIVFRMLTQLSGRQGWPVIIDHTVNTPVWNAPIVSYNIRYFNPANRSYTQDVRNALVTLSNWGDDPFRSGRNARARSAIGVMMEVEIPGAASETQQSYAPVYKRLSYQFQIEIDGQGQMVGGKWETRERPDFLWTVNPNKWPRTIADGRLPNVDWTGSTVPREWLNTIQLSSSRGQPLHKVLYKLVEMSR